MIAFKKLPVIAAVLFCITIEYCEGQQKGLLSQVPHPKLKWKVPLTKCCDEVKPFYALGFDSCKAEKLPVVWPPHVYVMETNKTVDVSRIEFSLLTNLTSCPEGYISKSSTEFNLNTDGTVTLGNDGQQLNSNEFCLNQIAEQPTISQVSFTVRYCVPDPCKQNNCVRKCCPTGMALNTTSTLCQPTKDSFNLIFHNPSGQEVKPNSRSYIIQDSSVPKCPIGMYSLAPQDFPDDTFYILPDGQIYVPVYPKGEKHSTEYCVDDFILDSGIARQALMCFPELEKFANPLSNKAVQKTPNSL